MSSHIHRFLEENGNFYISGGITNFTVGLLTDKIMNGLNSLFQKNRVQQLVEYISINQLNHEDIIKILRDLAFCLYFERIGNAQYKVSQSPLTSLFAGLKYKVQGKSFFEGCVAPIYQRYRTATREINTTLIYFINKMVESNIISDEIAYSLDKLFLWPTHVDYEEMIFDDAFDNNSFIDTLRKYDKAFINKYFSQKYPNIISMRHPCNGDNYKSYIRQLGRDNVQEGCRFIYESE